MLHPLVYFLVLFSSSIRAVAASTSIPGQNGDFSCGQGVQGRVTHLQRGSVDPFQPDVFVTDCSALKANTPSLPDTSPNDLSLQSSAPFPENRLGKRQLISKCGSDCVTVCSLASNGPSYKDCSTLSNYLFGRGSQFSVGAFQKVSVTAGSCMYTFLNTNLFSVSWCDATWAAQGGSVSGSCSAGGSCLGLLFTVSVESNPNPPPPPAPTSSAPPTTSQNAPSSSPDTGGQGQPNSQSTSSSRAPSNTASNSNAAPSTSTSRTTVQNNGGITEFSSILEASNLAALTSSLQSLSTLTATSSYVRTTTTLSNGAVITVIAPPDGSVGTGGNNNLGSGDQGSPNRKSKGPIIAGIVIAILLVVGIAIALMFWRQKRKEKRTPPPIYIDPARASAYSGEKPLNSPVAYTIHSGDEDHERGFGRAIRNSDSGHNGSGASARINSMMSGDTDLTIWTPRAKEQHQMLPSTLVPVMNSDTLHSDSPTTSSSGHQYHYTKVSGNTSNVVHPNLAGMGAPTLTIVSPTPSPTPRSPEQITRHLAFNRDAPRSTIVSGADHLGIARDANSEDDHSCYAREQLDEARADAAGVDLERISAPPVVLPSEFSSPLSTTRILDEGARLSTSTGVGSRSSRSVRIPSLLPTARHPQRTTFGVENPASSGDVLPRRSVDTSGARRSGRVSGSVVGTRMSEEEEEESPGFARLTTAFESASSVEGHSPFEQSSSTSK